MKKKLTILIAIIIAALSINIKLTDAHQGGPDSYGYIWTDSKDPEPKTTYDWDDISPTGIDIEIHADDGEYGPYPIPVPFSPKPTKRGRCIGNASGLYTSSLD